MTTTCTPQAHAPAPPSHGPCPHCDMPRCNGTTNTGRCRRQPIKGGTVCPTHGGRAPQVKAAAERRQVEAEAERVLSRLVWNPDAQPVVDSVSEMRRLAGALGQAVNVLGSRLNGEVCESCGRGPEPLDGPTAAAWMRGIREQRQLLAEMKRLGLEEHQIEVLQEQAQVVTSAFLAALGVVALLPADRDAMLRAFLAGIGRGPEVLEASAGGAA